jgi:hypothetical protein
MPKSEVRAALLKQAETAQAKPRKESTSSVVFTGPASAPRTIVVERKPARRTLSASRPAVARPLSLATQR